MKFRKNLGNRGFTLVELMIVIVIIGVLAALASYGFLEYIKKSKSAEADEFVKKIGDGAKVYYTKEQRYGGDETWHTAGAEFSETAPGMPVKGSEKTFPGGSSVGMMWTADEPPKGGGKIVPVLTKDDTQKAVWKTLGMSSTDPAYFRYGYQASGAGTKTQDGASGTPTGTGATACVIAEADFDGKGEVATECEGETGGTKNQLLKKPLRAINGDVRSLPAVLYNQGN